MAAPDPCRTAGDYKICGLPLDLHEDDALKRATPLEGVTVIKGLNEDGDAAYYVRATESLTTVECLGMAQLAVLKLKRGLINNDLREDDDEEDA